MSRLLHSTSTLHPRHKVILISKLYMYACLKTLFLLLAGTARIPGTNFTLVNKCSCVISFLCLHNSRAHTVCANGCFVYTIYGFVEHQITAKHIDWVYKNLVWVGSLSMTAFVTYKCNKQQHRQQWQHPFFLVFHRHRTIGKSNQASLTLNATPPPTPHTHISVWNYVVLGQKCFAFLWMCTVWIYNYDAVMAVFTISSWLHTLKTKSVVFSHSLQSSHKILFKA